MSNTKFKQLYEKYVLDETSEEERAAFLSLLLDAEDDELLTVEEVLALQQPELPLSKRKTSAIYKNITGSDLHIRRSLFGFNPAYLSAAALFIGILFTALYFWKISDGHDKRTYSEIAAISNSTRFVKSVLLQDGSKVFLKQGARLAILSDFDHDTVRRVKLQGEASFEVARNPSKAFCIMESGSFDVRVLGTAFNFINLPAQNNLVLKHGKVQVSHGDQKMYVAPGEGVAFDAKKLSFKKSTVDTTVSALWLHQFVSFKNEPVLQIVNDLNMLYPEAGLVLQDAYKKQNFTGYLPSNDLDKSIEILNNAFNNIIIFKR